MTKINTLFFALFLILNLTNYCALDELHHFEWYNYFHTKFMSIHSVADLFLTRTSVELIVLVHLVLALVLYSLRKKKIHLDLTSF